MGGFTRIGVDAGGSKIAPTIHDFVTSLKLVTPTRGTAELAAKEGAMFQLAKDGLGCLDVGSERLRKLFQKS